MSKDQKKAAASSKLEENLEPVSILEASQSVVATFKFDGTSQSIKIEGRGPSVLGSIQGDHVTAYALVKRGFARTLQDLELNSEESLTDLKEKRGKIYNFVSAIGTLDESRRDNLYEGITQILRNYNQQRFKKSEISSIESFAIEQQATENHEIADTILSHMGKEKLANGQIICSSLEKMAETLITFYNKTPASAFLQIEGFEAPSNEGPKVTAVLNRLERFSSEQFDDKKKEFFQNQRQTQQEIEKLESEIKSSGSNRRSGSKVDKKSKKLEEKRSYLDSLDFERLKFKEVVQNISSLFFYPEIESSLLEIHEKETADLKVSTAFPRNNTKENLVSAAAKHMHIVLAAYPELERFGQDQLTSVFVAQVISQPYEVKNPANRRKNAKNTKRECGWPSFNNEQSIKEISDAVIANLRQLQESTGHNLYSETERFRSVQSSKEPSRRESGDLEVGDIDVKMSASEQEDGGLFQQHVLNGISDEDFIIEMQRRMGATNPEIAAAVRREINDNKVLDKNSLVEIFSDIGKEIRTSREPYDKEKFDELLYTKFSTIIQLENLESENFLQTIDPNDDGHYQEIVQSISGRIQNIETVTIRDLKSIISEEYQNDHTSQRQQSTAKVGGRY